MKVSIPHSGEGVQAVEVLFSFVADYANKEQSGKLNVLGIFNRIYATDFPSTHRRMYLVFKMAAKSLECDVEHDMKIVLVGQDGEEFGAREGKFLIKRPEGAALGQVDFIFELADILFPYEGIYEINIVINKEVKDSVPLDLVKVASSSVHM